MWVQPLSFLLIPVFQVPPWKWQRAKIEVIRSIDFKADSLVLILYDNGVVDGDTVSVVINGKVIIPQQGLSEKAYRKVIPLTPDLGDSLQLVMYCRSPRLHSTEYRPADR